MMTIRQALAGTTGLLLVAAMASTASAEGRRNKGHGGSPQNGAAGAQFSGPACQVGSSGGHLQFLNGRTPFRGRSHGAYGGIFFAGGGTTVPRGASDRSEGGGSAAAGGGAPAGGGSTGAPGSGSSAGAPGGGSTGTSRGSDPSDPDAPAATAPGGASGGEVEDDHGSAQHGENDHGGGAPAAPGGAGHSPISVTPNPVAVNPEPGSLLLIGTGLTSIFLARRRQRKPRG